MAMCSHSPLSLANQTIGNGNQPSHIEAMVFTPLVIWYIAFLPKKARFYRWKKVTHVVLLDVCILSLFRPHFLCFSLPTESAAPHLHSSLLLIHSLCLCLLLIAYFEWNQWHVSTLLCFDSTVTFCFSLYVPLMNDIFKRGYTTLSPRYSDEGICQLLKASKIDRMHPLIENVQHSRAQTHFIANMESQQQKNLVTQCKIITMNPSFNPISMRCHSGRLLKKMFWFLWKVVTSKDAAVLVIDEND